jgi:hypothetical protein
MDFFPLTALFVMEMPSVLSEVRTEYLYTLLSEGCCTVRLPYVDFVVIVP